MTRRPPKEDAQELRGLSDDYLMRDRSKELQQITGVVIDGANCYRCLNSAWWGRLLASHLMMTLFHGFMEEGTRWMDERTGEVMTAVGEQYEPQRLEDEDE